MGWDTLNMITTLGAFLFALGVLLFLINVCVSLRRGAAAGPNPWDAPTLEWSMPSPPPPYNFAVIPTVASRHPLWEDRLDEGPRPLALDARLPARPRPRDARHQRARRRARRDPEDARRLACAVAAGARAAVGCSPALLLHCVVARRRSAAVAARSSLLVWLWPRAASSARRAEAGAWLTRTSPAPRAAGRQHRARSGVGWWGMLCLIATEAALFAYLLFSYFYLGVPDAGPAGRPEPHPSLQLALPNTVILLVVSSVAVWWGEQRRQAATGAASRSPASASPSLLGVVFVGVQGSEWSAKPFGLVTSAYGSLYFTITGFHMAHVVVGLVMLAPCFVWARLGYFDRAAHAPVAIGVALLALRRRGLAVRLHAFYITPYLMTP